MRTTNKSTDSLSQNGIMPIDVADVNSSNKSKNDSSIGNNTNTFISVQSLSLPKGGGAIQGMNGQLQMDEFTGTASFSVPIFTTPCRDFYPQLSLTYASGAGNGPWGLGFSLNLPSIARRTSQRIPRYNTEDVFLLTGADYLVPVASEIRQERLQGADYKIQTYKPCIEGLFALIEYWQIQPGQCTAADFWRVIHKDHTIQIFGKTDQAKIFDPKEPNYVFQWLLEETYDAKGQHQLFFYKAEDQVNLPLVSYEQNRTQNANKYLQCIRYGNAQSVQDSLLLTDNSMVDDASAWHFEVIFDYGEYDSSPTNANIYNPIGTWLCREDAFSEYKAGFEIRTHRRCQQTLMFHRFKEKFGETPILVHATQYNYQYGDIARLSHLVSMQEIGYSYQIADKRKDSNVYIIKEKPAIQFQFQAFDPIHHQFQKLSKENDQLLTGLDTPPYTLVDLFGEGIPGILYSDNQSVAYQQPSINTEQIKYSAPVILPSFPIEHKRSNQNLTLMDINSNGKMDVLVMAKEAQGYYEVQPDQSWQGYKSFDFCPTQEPSQQWVDLSGTGLQDLLQIEQNRLRVYPAKRFSGWDSAYYQSVPNDFPMTFSGSETLLRTFADMAGTGLAQLVQISNSEIKYWPSLGYGQFAQSITMQNSPCFTEDFSIKRLFLADLDGSGTTDLIYFSQDKAFIYFNQNGNGFTEPYILALPASFDQLTQIQFADIYGNGTTCFLFGITYGENTLQYWCYDFCNQLKPYLLNKIDNQYGAVTEIEYKSSVHYYLEDKQQDRSWQTNLPFPVQVVSKVSYKDEITGSCLISKYGYHHGYYDGIEREFRGFGCVEKQDAETFIQTITQKQLSAEYVAPTLTKTWYHTGAESSTHSRQFAGEYYQQDLQAFPFSDSSFDQMSSDSETRRQAHRALKGQILRQEMYGLDGKIQEVHPYVVTENNYQIFLKQAKEQNNSAVFTVSPKETIRYSYERNPQDPKIDHQLNLEIDDYGNITRNCIIAYPRRPITADVIKEQQALKISCATQTYVNQPGFENYLVGIPVESKSYEVIGLIAPIGAVFSFNDMQEILRNLLDNNEEYEKDEVTAKANLIGWNRIYYAEVSDTTTASLSLKEIALPLLPAEQHIAEFSQEQIASVFNEVLTTEELEKQLRLGYYSFNPETGYWWNPGLKQEYFAAGQFYSSKATVDPKNNRTSYAYDPHHLLLIQIIDPLGNLVTAENINYQLLSPTKLIDENKNVSEVDFDALGQVVYTSFYGSEEGKCVGFQPISQAPNFVPNNIEEMVNAPEKYLGNMQSFFFYDLFAWQNRKEPILAIGLIAENYPETGQQTPIQITISYNDGFGRNLQNKTKVEPGVAFYYDSTNKEITNVSSNNRWLVSGCVVYNNKGNPVKQYEPYYFDSSIYINDEQLNYFGVTSILYYDPLGRVYQKVLPAGFLEKHEWTPWQEKIYDANDTIKESPYYNDNDCEHDQSNPDVTSLYYDLELKRVGGEDNLFYIEQYFYNTPTTHILDNVGRTIIIKQIKKSSSETGEQFLSTYSTYDIVGNLLTTSDPRLNKNNINNFEMIYSLTSKPLKTISADAGTSWLLTNIFGNEILNGNNRKVVITTEYDALQRPISIHVQKQKTIQDESELDNVVQRFIYGDTPSAIDNPESYNLRGKLYKHYDLAGEVINTSYAITGQVLLTERRFLKEYKTAVNWNNDVNSERITGLLENETYRQTKGYDALGRVIQETDIDGNITRPEYNLLGLLKQLEVTKADNEKFELTTYVANISYNAKGQRERIDYGNATNTCYRYDLQTWAVTNIKSIHSSKVVLQDLSYSYDPIGNIVQKTDKSLDTIYYNNQEVSPEANYKYDSLYQLIEAQGRQKMEINTPNSGSSEYLINQTPVGQDLNALENYWEKYSYDLGGNLVKTVHTASNSWTRNMVVSDKSNRAIIEGINNNDCIPSAQEVDKYFDAVGNQIKTQTLHSLVWDYGNHLQQTISVKRDGGKNDAEYYVYDSSGQRVRKIFEQYAQGETVLNITETRYLGNIEIRRQLQSDNLMVTTVKEEYHALRVMDDHNCIATKNTWTKGELPIGIENPAIFYHLTDHLGSATMEIDESGNLISIEEFAPYGNSTLFMGLGSAEQLKTHRYSGKERDSVTGFYYYGARYYAPWLNRWLNPDPAGMVDGLNLYAFVKGNPANYVDYNGNISWREAVGKLKVGFYKSAKYLFDPLLPAIVSIGGVTSNAAANIWNPAGRNEIGGADMTISALAAVGEGAALYDAWQREEITNREAVRAVIPLGISGLCTITQKFLGTEAAEALLSEPGNSNSTVPETSTMPGTSTTDFQDSSSSAAISGGPSAVVVSINATLAIVNAAAQVDYMRVRVAQRNRAAERAEASLELQNAIRGETFRGLLERNYEQQRQLQNATRHEEVHIALLERNHEQQMQLQNAVQQARFNAVQMENACLRLEHAELQLQNNVLQLEQSRHIDQLH